jgi:riboflavin kinase/FMN adenylyltransferase
MTDEEFLTDVLIERFKMKHIVMGENFRFGRGREGDITFLKGASLRYGFEFSVVSPVHLGDVRISSTLIRNLLAEGDIETANRMLGREYFIEGVVVEGDRRGRGLGYPTININTGNTLLPEGVFQAMVELDGRLYRSISYIGTRPTFKGKEKKVEAHLFDFNSRAYDKCVRVMFQKKIRGDMAFQSETQLANQIKKDIENLNFVDKGRIF